MNTAYIKYLLLSVFLLIPVNTYSGLTLGVDIPGTDDAEEELIAYYDLRERSTYVQVSNISDESDENPLCIHVQVFQQDKGCLELDFNDELTANDTVVYDLDDLIRNNGSEVPINLDDDSYGFVAVSAINCSDDEDDGDDNLIGNFRIIDNTGYEYRMNMISESDPSFLGGLAPGTTQFGDVIIPFNTIAGANRADIVGFYYNDDNRGNVNGDEGSDDSIYNIEEGLTFSVFMVDEDEERLSCDQVTFACGLGKFMNYGINEDYPNSRGGPLLCEGAGLLPGQSHGYIVLEDGLNNVVDGDDDDDGEFACFIGINNNDGTGSMDECIFNDDLPD